VQFAAPAGDLLAAVGEAVDDGHVKLPTSYANFYNWLKSSLFVEKGNNRRDHIAPHIAPRPGAAYKKECA
jgi:hypothetical protein